MLIINELNYHLVGFLLFFGFKIQIDFFALIFLNFLWKTEEQDLKLAKSGTFSVILTHSGVQFTMDKKGQTPFKFLEFFLTFKGHFSPSILHLGIT